MNQPDNIPAPNVLNILRVGNFQMRIIAYRTLSSAECQIVASQWLKSQKRRTFPTSGTVTVHSMIGFVQ
jgi:hypothetical protein